MKNQLIIRKLPIRFFIDQLIDLYNTGVDFIDIKGENKEGQDNVEIIIRDDYYCSQEELVERHEEEKLSDDDINQLI